MFSKIGNATVFQPINTSGIVKYMEFVETGGQANDTFTFEITSSGTAISSGNGYTALLETGNDLDKSTIQFHINYTSGSGNAENDVFISLHANEDFLRVWVE